MARRLTINALFMIVFTAIMVGFAVFATLTFSKSSKRIDLEYQENLRFRSSTFRDAIGDSLIMGDYPTVLSKSRMFFSQKDVRSIEIKLADNSTLVAYAKKNQATSEENQVALTDYVSIRSESGRDSVRVASLTVRYDLSFLSSVQDDWIGQGLLSTISLLLVAGSAVFVLSKLVNRPIMRLSKIVVRGDLHEISNLSASSHISEIRALEDSLAVMGHQIINLNERDAENVKNAAVGKITAQISHDLRAPLNFIERLMYIPDDRAIGEVKQELNACIFRMNSMIESLRYTDIEAMIKPQKSRLDLLSALALVKAKADQNSIRLIEPSIAEQDIALWIDLPKFERAWINLASNAIDFARTEVHLDFEISGTQLVLRIIDDGPGVPDEFLPKLFQRGATHGKHDGTGLGLAYVRQIMRGHGGDVTYRRENGLTIFECRLPNAIVENQEDDMFHTPAAVANEVAPVKRVGICFVPKSMAESLCAELASLKSEKFSFSTEYNGADVVATNDPDLALTATEEGKQPLEFRAKLVEAVILEGLKRRFDLV